MGTGSTHRKNLTISTTPSAQPARAQTLTELARVGFSTLNAAASGLEDLSAAMTVPADAIVAAFRLAADPDTALWRILDIAATQPELLRQLTAEQFERLTLLVGASPAMGDFYRRNPENLSTLLAQGGTLRSYREVVNDLCDSVSSGSYSKYVADSPESNVEIPAGDATTLAELSGQAGWDRLRVRYRELLAELMLYDLEQSRMRTETNSGSAADLFDQVSEGLSDLAVGVIEAALLVARRTLVTDGGSGAPVPAHTVGAVDIGVVAMGKCGAQELNVVSDVDVLFVVAPAAATDVNSEASTAVTQDDVLRVGARIASETMRAIHAPSTEPALWELDANLRPEGKNGPLVRTLGSYMSYYERWAETWEFQALLKARPAAGAFSLAQQFVDLTRPLVWESSNREDFVGSVRRMRERVTEHIDLDDIDYELKLGPGGLRDVEFSVQLLQLVHGNWDESLRVPGTIAALEALVDGGYVSRSDGQALAETYRQTRVLEHRLQLRDLRRTAKMPNDAEQLRVLARATGLATTGAGLLSLWESNKKRVRQLHQKIFYAPIVAAVAELPDIAQLPNTDVQAATGVQQRLRSLKFQDPDGALRNLAALTIGSSRRAAILRNLLPVLLQWLGEGTSPDQGLLAFRRLTEAAESIPWFLRLLRDGSEAAERLTTVLSSSKFAAELLITQPEAVAWLENDRLLFPTEFETLREEMLTSALRRPSDYDAAAAIRAIHRREVLRVAMGKLVGVNSEHDVAEGLNHAHTALLEALLSLVQRMDPAFAEIEMSLIAMGRFGGQEMGFSSDIDLIAVYRAPSHVNNPRATGIKIVQRLRELMSDPRFAVDLDFDLRPEGKTGPLVRNLEGYETYYQRWSVAWEAQALLRARAVVGSAELGSAFLRIADEVRYPKTLSEDNIRQIRTLKARVEKERLPRGQDPRRNFKLGPGGVSDTEWLVQLLQLQHAHEYPALRTTSTIGALRAAVNAGLFAEADARILISAWQFASAARSAEKLWSGKATDTMPTHRADIEGIARILGYPPNSTTEFEERWYTLSRKARKVFEQHFYGQVLSRQHLGADQTRYPDPRPHPFS